MVLWFRIKNRSIYLICHNDHRPEYLRHTFLTLKYRWWMARPKAHPTATRITRTKEIRVRGPGTRIEWPISPRYDTISQPPPLHSRSQTQGQGQGHGDEDDDGEGGVSVSVSASPPPTGGTTPSHTFSHNKGYIQPSVFTLHSHRVNFIYHFLRHRGIVPRPNQFH